MPSQTKLPGSADQDASGSVSWSNVNNILTSDDSRATAAPTSGSPTHLLYGTNFGFSIPSNATITGVELYVELSKTAGVANCNDSQVRLWISGAAGSENKARAGNNWTTSDVDTLFGSQTDVWGESLTPAIVNASNFGGGIAAKQVASTPTAQIDHLYMTVYYTVPSSASSIRLSVDTVNSSVFKKKVSALSVSGLDDSVTRTTFRFLDRANNQFQITTSQDGVVGEQSPIIAAARLGYLEIDLPQGKYRVNILDQSGNALVSEFEYKQALKGTYAVKTARNDAGGVNLVDTTETKTARGATIDARTHVTETRTDTGVRIVSGGTRIERTSRGVRIDNR